MNSPYRTTTTILDDIHRNLRGNPNIRDSAAYKREALNQLQRNSVFPADRVHQYLQVLLKRDPFASKTVEEYGSDGARKSNIPAAQRKARGGDWRLTTADLDDEFTRSPTSSAGLRRKKRELGMTGRDTRDPRDVVTELSTDTLRSYQDKVMSRDGFKNGAQTINGIGHSQTRIDKKTNPIPRDIEKPEAPDFSWVSNFDITEIKQAVDKIVDHISSNMSDEEQVHLLRNDIRVLDNLASALKSGDGEKIVATWKIACSEEACEHLHDEFINRMNKTVKKSGKVAESFGEFLNPTKPEDVLFTEYGTWARTCIQRGYRVTESAKTCIIDAHTETGDLVGAFHSNRGWIYEAMEESAPPGEEEWITKNKQAFIDQYGEGKGTSILYATAWKNYNKKHGKK